MEKSINDAIELLAKKINKECKSEDALRFTQSALNLAHVLQVKEQVKVIK